VGTPEFSGGELHTDAATLQSRPADPAVLVNQ
jgi:hypothetical protein